MTHQDVLERLLDLSHGRLDDRTANDVRAHLGKCEECRAEARVYEILHVWLSSEEGMEEDHPGSEEIVAYAENRETLDPQSVKSIADHLARCEPCAEQVERTGRVLESIRKRPGPVHSGAAGAAPLSFSLNRWGALAATLLVAALAYPAYLGLFRLPEAERLQSWSGTSALNVLPRSSREGAVAKVSVEPDQPFVAIGLELLVPRGVEDTEVLLVAIRDADDREVWSLELTASRIRSDVAEWGVATLIVSAEPLRAGRHSLEVARVDHPDEDPLLRVAFDLER